MAARVQSENTQHATTQDLKTDDPISSVLVGEQNAIVGHRDDFVPSPPRRCPVRVRYAAATAVDADVYVQPSLTSIGANS